ncbi:MAG: twin-arginine translocase subunit TatC [Flavobacteriales bacterium]|nr:twin-arginine translocase subunit TatC [Flavobacteriales bacterium]MCB9363646.1 twin-arginine translocase subunit TatC [Flavobacteriales bacterium]
MSKETKNRADMSFLEHLEVLRWHLVRSSIAVLVFMIAIFSFKSFVFDEIILAQKNSNFWTYEMFCKISHWLGKGDTLCMDDISFSLINITMSGQFTMHLIVSLIGGLILGFPYILFEIWRFISPALENKERKYARGLVFAGSFLFAIGILFGYYLISPLSVQFLGNYKVSDLVENQISLSSFISTVTTITLACGLVFQLPLIIYFLAKVGLVTPEFLRKYRKHAIVVTLILSAIITPPDVSSQVLMTVPLLILYEFSIFVAKRVVKNNK